MNSREYWRRREEEALKHYLKEEAAYDRELKRIYQNMLDACQKEIESFYAKYAAAEGISIAQAKRRVSKLDIAAYERKAAKYVKEKNFSKKANEEMRLYNATMRINRLEMLKANIGLETIAGHDEMEKFMAGILKGRTMDELQRQAGILGKTVKNNAQLANAIVNGSFHNGTFSDRIWQYQDLMREDLGKLLQQGLIQGKGARAIAKDLRKYWYGNDPKTGGGAKYCMERLMRTELARVQTEAQKQSFERNGFDHYIFIVNGGCCPLCEATAKKKGGFSEAGVYLVKDMMPGLNAPPMHPNCRCSTASWVDPEEYEAWQDFLDQGGTTAEWEKTGKAEWQKQKKALENSENSSKIESGATMGAYNSKNDADGKKRDAHADRYYESMRNRKKDPVVSAISRNSGISKESVSKMFDHLFIKKYRLDKGVAHFDSDYYIAESVRRLQEGKRIQKHDIILIKHEAMEYDLMNNKGMSYEEAHAIANKSYNYQKALAEWLDETEGW